MQRNNLLSHTSMTKPVQSQCIRVEKRHYIHATIVNRRGATTCVWDLFNFIICCRLFLYHRRIRVLILFIYSRRLDLERLFMISLLSLVSLQEVLTLTKLRTSRCDEVNLNRYPLFIFLKNGNILCWFDSHVVELFSLSVGKFLRP